MKTFDWVPLIFDRVVVATVFASALAIGIAFLQWCFGARLNAAWRFCLWSLVMVRLLIPGLPQSPTSLFNLARLWNSDSPTNNVQRARVAESPTPAPHHRLESGARAPHLRSQSPDALNKWGILAFLWSIGAGLLLLRLVLGSIWLRFRLARETSVPNGRAESILVQVISPGKVSPTITETTLIASPSVFGCFRPKILLPKGLAEQFTESQLRDVFIHEIGHIRRWDLWTNMLMSIAGALHWFNPIVWMVFRRMRIERELACDAIVLESTGPEGAKSYGQTLLAMFERLCPNPARSGVIGMLEEKQAARYRLAQIASFNFQRGTSRRIGIPLLAGAALIGLTDASERKSDPVITSPNLAVLTTNALGYDIVTSVTNLNFSRRKFDRIIIPEFGVTKALPLSRVLVRLGEEIRKCDSNNSGLTFMIRSRSSLNHPRLDDFLVRVDPPLKNVRLDEICDAIASAARAPVEEFKTIKVAYSVEADRVTFLEAELFNIEFTIDDLSEAERLCKFLGDQGIDVFATPIQTDNFLGTQIEFSKRGLFFKPGRLTARGIASEIERAAAIIEDRGTKNLTVPGLSKAIPTRSAYSIPIPTATLWNATTSGRDIAPAQISVAMQLSPLQAPLAPGVYKSTPYSGYVIVPESNIDSSMLILPRSDKFDRMPMLQPDPPLKLLPRSQVNPQVLLDSSR